MQPVATLTDVVVIALASHIEVVHVTEATGVFKLTQVAIPVTKPASVGNKAKPDPQAVHPTQFPTTVAEADPRVALKVQAVHPVIPITVEVGVAVEAALHETQVLFP